MNKFLKPKFNLEMENHETNFGRFVVEPLERGFGTTLGNAIRRTLLSSTPGSAVYAVRITNAPHEFSTVDGIVENVTRIVLNIKELVINIDENVFPDNKEVVLKINSSQPGELTAGEIKCPAGVEILNKDHVICTIADGGTFEAEFYAKKSRGYRTFEQNKTEVVSVGVIPIDSNYSPIRRISYSIEPTKIGRTTEFEKLILDVNTDGSITPSDAVAIASKILVEHLTFFVNLNEEIKNVEVITTTNEEEDNTLDKSIEDLNFTVRSYNCLKRAGIQTLKELVDKTEYEMLNVRNLGKKSFLEIKEKLEELELSFRRD